MAPQPTDRTIAQRPIERRQQRLTIPPCENCGSTSTGVATRTEYVVYLRCPACWYVWSLPKPGRELVST